MNVFRDSTYSRPVARCTRAAMNYQYRNGGTTTQAFRALYREGGVVRFYRGYFAALAQAPLARFGDTAANMGMLTLLSQFDETKDLNPAIKTFAASTRLPRCRGCCTLSHAPCLALACSASC